MNATDRLINLFFMTHRSLHKHMQESKVMASFSFLQFLALKYMTEAGPVRMKDIASFLSITPASATSLVDGLAKAGLLERSPDKNDRRIVRLRVTTTGRKRLDATDADAKRELKRIFQKLDETDRVRMGDVLEKLAAILADEKQSAPPRGGH